MKLFAALSLVVSTTVTWVLMLTHRPDPELANVTLFSYQGISKDLPPEQMQVLEQLRTHGVRQEALVFSGTRQEVLFNLSAPGNLAWIKDLPSSGPLPHQAAERLRPLMKAVWQLAQVQLLQEGVNLNQVQKLGLWHPQDLQGLKISATLEEWGL